MMESAKQESRAGERAECQRMQNSLSLGDPEK